MKIAIASDHRGVNHKIEVIKYLESINMEVIDCSQNNTPTDDYPDFAFAVCKKVIKKEAGIGMSIAANKVKGIRCAKINSVEDATLSRNDNGANVMTFNYTESIETLKSYIAAFLKAEVINDARHQRRVDKIIKYENGEYNEL